MKLVSDSRKWWKMWSIRLAALAGIFVTYLAENPDVVNMLLAFLPDGPLRVLGSIAVGFIVFAVPAGARLLQQPVRAKEYDSYSTT